MPTSCSADMLADLTDVVAPSAVVSGGLMTLPTPQHHSVSSTRVSPWQRAGPDGTGRALTRVGGGSSCSYGVSSPCCKLLPTATVASPSSFSYTSSSSHPRSVTLPRGHSAVYSGEVATRLRPPPPPSAAAIRQAAQRAAVEATPTTGKTLEARRRPDRRGGPYKNSADSNTEQRRSISTVIV